MKFDLSFAAVLTIIFALISSVLVVLLTRQTERLKIAETQLSQQKYRAYHELVSIFFDLLKDIKADRTHDMDVFRERLMDIKKDLFIYGSDNLINLLSNWLYETTNNPNNSGHFLLYLDMLIAVRKDMGRKKTKISRKDIVRLLIQGEDVIQEFSKMIGLEL